MKMTLTLIQKQACLCSDEAWSLSPYNADNIASLHQKYPNIQFSIVSAEFDSPAFKQQATAYYEVHRPTVLKYQQIK